MGIYDIFFEEFGVTTDYKSVALPIELWEFGRINRIIKKINADDKKISKLLQKLQD